jgi:hypothetical protein
VYVLYSVVYKYVVYNVLHDAAATATAAAAAAVINIYRERRAPSP